MNNDLISREYAKAKMFDIPKPKEGATFWDGVDTVGEIIDNAPTVDIDEMTQDLINKVNVNIGLAKPIKDERPQGEWIEKQETPASVSYHCSICNMEDLPITPYCPWCGAKMKGGTE